MFTEKNAIYLIAGYIVFLGGISTYLLSLVLRRHNIKRDRELLEQIEQQINEEQSDQTSRDQTNADQVKVEK
ncbi:MAG: hypothetical protein M1434_04110 [Chloroflexi bacterium]|nr:hypothetical protein [Chloroflexota bacterium]MCL5273916.1 hypothetical protein [Chloroflexota bacterium]